MKRLLLGATLACAGCWDFSSLSARRDLAGADLAGADLASTMGFLYEDFESGSLTMPWKPDVGSGSGGVVEITTTEHHGGSHALHVFTPGTGTVFARIRDAALPSPMGTALYVRYWVRVTTASSATPYTLFSLVEEQPFVAGTGGPDPVGAGIGSDGQWALNDPTDESNDLATFVIGQWMCVVMEVDPSTATLTVGDAVGKPLLAPTVEVPLAVDIGIARGNSNAVQTEAYVDDVVLSYSPLACN